MSDADDILDDGFVWYATQRSDGLREKILQLQVQHDQAQWDLRKMKELADENLELKLRLGILVRLLIKKGVIGAEEYAGLIADARPKPTKR